jgi:crotonobetainyl-CoA:carnitine CoA-transferase CaiB-like acyl-CoA transferase
MEGVKVVELGVWVAGPSASMILADWGADVLKVEPLSGDPYRELFRAGAGIDIETNPPFEMDNRGKRSLAVDVSSSEGAAIVADLAADADVFVTNVRLPALARAGLDYEDLAARNARLIYARITGFGEDGPDRDRAAYDVGAFWARAGVAASLTAEGSDPPFQRGGMGDHLTGLALASGISGALYAREHTGRGQLVTTSLLRAGIYFMGFDINTVLRLGFAFPPQTRRSLGNPLMSCFKTADGRWLWLIGLEADRHWPKLCRAVERTDWLDDDRLADVATRAGHADELYDALEEIFASRPLDDWSARLDAQDVWWAPVQTTEEVTADAQAHASGAFTDVPLTDGTSALMVSSPVDYSANAWTVKRPSPEIGEHTDELLTEAGYDADRLADLRRRGVIR